MSHAMFAVATPAAGTTTAVDGQRGKAEPVATVDISCDTGIR